MTIDINALRKNFASLSDADLRKLTSEALHLTSDGLKVLQEEIAKRNLPLMRTVDNVFKDEWEINKMIEEKCIQLRNQSCPVCSGDEYLINAMWIKKVTVFKISRVFHFACGKCLLEEKQKAESTTSLFGWWSPFTFRETHKALKDNDKEMIVVQTGEPTQSMLEFAGRILKQEFKSAMLEVDIEVQYYKPSV